MNFIFRFIAGVFGGNSPSPSRSLPIVPRQPLNERQPLKETILAPAPIPIPAPEVEKIEDGIVLINAAQFAAILNVDTTTFNRYRRKGVIPPSIEKPGRKNRWRMSDVDAWLEAGPWLSHRNKFAVDHRKHLGDIK